MKGEMMLNKKRKKKKTQVQLETFEQVQGL